jgi:TldD protein
MTARSFLSLILAAFAVSFSSSSQTLRPAKNSAGAQSDPLLRSMADELARAKTLQLNNLEKPYFISFVSNDSEQAVIAASLGGLTTSNVVRLRQPRIDIRVGSYAFDNTNSVFSGRQPGGLLPIDDEYLALRTSFWLQADALYKSAVDEITRKRTALREIASPDQTPDLAPAPPLNFVAPVARLQLDRGAWEERISRLSARFTAHPDVVTSNVQLLAAVTNYHLVNTEGTIVRVPETVAAVEIRADGLAPDGARVWTHQFLNEVQPSQLPSEGEIAKHVDEAASQVEALKKAPLMDDYEGPVLFENQAAAELMAQVMNDAARLRRKPVAPPESSARSPLDSVWASRLDTKVAPDWLTIIDDPARKDAFGKELAGSYEVDDEGVAASKVTLVENGVLKAYLMSRQPMRTFTASNGHGRLPGPYGGEAAVIGNLFIQASQQTPQSQMKAKLIERLQKSGLKYGMRIQSLDFPSTADVQELEDIVREMQKKGYVRTVTAPLLAYKVYPDGHEELVRGARFHEFSAKNLRDLELASDTPYVLNYVNNGTSFDIPGAASDATTSSVICPALLIEDVEIGHSESESTKPPLVPPPALVAQ